MRQARDVGMSGTAPRIYTAKDHEARLRGVAVVELRCSAPSVEDSAIAL
jgi:hypothetical protein